MVVPFKEYLNQIVSHPEEAADAVIHVSAVLAAAAISWCLLNAITNKVEKRCHTRPFFEKNHRFFVLVKRAGHYIIAFLVGLGLLDMFESPTTHKIFSAFMIMLLSSIACSMVHNILPYFERYVSTKTDTDVDDVILNLAKKFSGIVIYTAGGIMALDTLGLNVMPFLAGAGVAGIAIGFAAKDTLSNIISGILLIIDRPLKVGDRIEIWAAPANTATWGDVVEIGLRATKIRTTDNIIVIVPNNEIMNRDIVNYTAISDEIRVRIEIGISYESDVKKAKEIIINTSLEMDWVMNDPPPKVVVRNFGNSSIDLQARVWIRDPRRRMDTISYITDHVKDAFDQEGIEIPYPRRDIIIRKEAP